MRPVHADFRPVSRPGRVAWACVLLAGVLAAAALAHAVRAYTSAQALLRAQAEQASAHAAALQLPAASAPYTPPRYEASARQALAQRELPWPQALRELESVDTPGVVLRTFQADAETRVLRAEIVATSHAVLLEHVRQLEAASSAEPGSWVWRLESTAADGAGGAVSGWVSARSPAASVAGR
jgi:hypothetical protein